MSWRHYLIQNVGLNGLVLTKKTLFFALILARFSCSVETY